MQKQWNHEKINELYDLPLFDLVHQSYSLHQKHFAHLEMECCSLASIKTGSCPEDCAYCPQSAHYQTDIKKEKLIDLNDVLLQAKKAKASGAKRFCMGAAWRSPPKKDFPNVLRMVEQVKAMGLETCATLGMLTLQQAQQLKACGLDYYNHNLDTSRDYYPRIISTRQYDNRIETIGHAHQAGLQICCGGIFGMGESRKDRIDFFLALKSLPKDPQSIPINKLIPIKGTPLEHSTPINKFELIQSIAIIRLMFPTSMIRLAAGREDMSDEHQAWCFMAGCNSIFIGELLLTSKNNPLNDDYQLLHQLGISYSSKQSIKEQTKEEIKERTERKSKNEMKENAD